MMQQVLLSTAYFPPIQYLSKFIEHNIVIEKFENYSKQSYRNRCCIYGANGMLTLTVPTVKGDDRKIQISDVEVDYATNWQKLHWKGIESAYRSSPFYEYYVDYIHPLFTKKHKYLMDLNAEALDIIIDMLELEVDVQFTTDYIDSHCGIDFRDAIHPKKRLQKLDAAFIANDYIQVFGDKHGFIPNLSTLDLIFNLGPDALNYLEGSIQT